MNPSKEARSWKERSLEARGQTSAWKKPGVD